MYATEYNIQAVFLELPAAPDFFNPLLCGSSHLYSPALHQVGLPMVLTWDGTSMIGTRVRTNLSYLICLIRLDREESQIGFFSVLSDWKKQFRISFQVIFSRLSEGIASLWKSSHIQKTLMIKKSWLIIHFSPRYNWIPHPNLISY